MIAFHVGANMEFEVAGKLNRNAICSNFLLTLNPPNHLLIIPQQYIDNSMDMLQGQKSW
jgi:hypothetical protein